MPNRKTHEEFENEMKILNPNIKLLGKYTRAKDKIKCECLNCGNVWDARASHLKEGRGCSKCSHLKSNSDFLKELSNSNPNIIALEEYAGALNPISFKCKIDNHIWKSRPSSILYGHGCPVCGRKRVGDSLRKDRHQFLNEMKQLNPNIEILGEYTSNKNKILCRCKVDNNEWYTAPSNLLNGNGCPLCGIKRRAIASKKSNEEFLLEFKELNTNIELLSEYSDAKTKIYCKCKKCNNKWYSYPNNILKKHGCPMCAKNYKYGHETFVKKVENCQDGKDYIVLSKYNKSSEKVKFLHKKCGNIFEMVPNNFLRGTRCPYCNESKGEQKIRKFLNDNKIKYESQYSYDDLTGIKGGLLSYDFFLNDYNILIEFQGQFHDWTDNMQTKEQFEKQQEHDRRKREYAKLHNINLLEIWYYDFNNIDQILERELNL